MKRRNPVPPNMRPTKKKNAKRAPRSKPATTTTPTAPTSIGDILTEFFGKVLLGALEPLTEPQGAPISGPQDPGRGSGPLIQAEPLKTPRPVRLIEFCGNLAAMGLPNQFRERHGPACLLELHRVVLVATVEDGNVYEFPIEFRPPWVNPWVEGEQD